MLKKAVVVAFVIVTFVIYSFHQRNEGGRAVSQVAVDTTKKTAQTTTVATTYKDGSYVGKSSDAYYGYIQVKAVIAGGKITAVDFLDYPQDRRNSVEINDYAMPQLQQQAIRAQSAQVDGISGATDTSQAFTQSLSDALSQAKA